MKKHFSVFFCVFPLLHDYSQGKDSTPLCLFFLHVMKPISLFGSFISAKVIYSINPLSFEVYSMLFMADLSKVTKNRHVYIDVPTKPVSCQYIKDVGHPSVHANLLTYIRTAFVIYLTL